jgi:iron-sulfur cluster repair protein YtfE (RIC family)
MPPSRLHQISKADVVNDVIAAMPRTIGVFNDHGIDACCGGAVTIREAAERDGADLYALMRALHQVVYESVRPAAMHAERPS